jgi:hypothetical protein
MAFFECSNSSRCFVSSRNLVVERSRGVEKVTEIAKGCHLNITERGEIYNPIFRFVSRFVLGHTATLDAYLQNVARKFGSTAVPMEGKPNLS